MYLACCIHLFVTVLVFSLFMHSCILGLGFGVFQKNWGFLVFPKIFGLGFVKLLLYSHALHSNNVSCIIDACFIIV